MYPQIDHLISTALGAGEIIMDFYRQQNFIKELKSDRSPVTSADKLADEFICAALNKRYPKIPIISEESLLADFRDRQQWTDFFLVDPLDGTKEFLKRNGEFTVNIAYISPSVRMSVIWAPALDKLYYADGVHCFKRIEGQDVLLTKSDFTTENIVVVSRSHINSATQDYIDTIADHHLLRVGSSLKFCYLAEGVASWYPRLGPINEWDIAAGVVILEQAGGVVSHLDDSAITFNKPSMLVDAFCAKSLKNK